MGNPLNTPENRRAIADLHATLSKPTTGYNAWLRMILGQKAYENIAELNAARAGHFVADRLHRHGKHD